MRIMLNAAGMAIVIMGLSSNARSAECYAAVAFFISSDDRERLDEGAVSGQIYSGTGELWARTRWDVFPKDLAWSRLWSGACGTTHQISISAEADGHRGKSHTFSITLNDSDREIAMRNRQLIGVKLERIRRYSIYSIFSDPPRAHVYGDENDYWGQTTPEKGVRRRWSCDSDDADLGEQTITLKKQLYKATTHTWTLRCNFKGTKSEAKAAPGKRLVVVLDALAQ